MAIAALYPLWGALIGGTGAALLLRSSFFLPWVLLAWIAFAFLEERFLHAPRGRHVLGAVVLTPVWFYVFGSLHSSRLVLTAVTAHAVSRASVIALAWVSRPAKEGMRLSKNLDSFSAGLAIACGALPAFLCGFRPAVVMILAAFLILRVGREWYYRQLGGINATALSLTQRATELSTLLIVALVT